MAVVAGMFFFRGGPGWIQTAIGILGICQLIYAAFDVARRAGPVGVAACSSGFVGILMGFMGAVWGSGFIIDIVGGALGHANAASEVLAFVLNTGANPH
jgi:hypothetical protein